ncbi:hypothetical protein MUN81_01350 [Hymenobacter sp. 5317J-9]|uniref:hypothetical protein n=1 Tax=Hymenobacter sp. 5317J-9 TaxID=2932250 RepID=UPI001FD67BF7|nr:hypothetical protein [Hymenobacter sp. 5317J-9]UOQ98151.1 hypothetical protein MUN81_01350 [Hymenobacter sp. 5317J-9]
MKQFYRLRLALGLLLLLASKLAHAQTEGTLAAYQTIVCPGERTTISVSVNSNVTVAGAVAVTNGSATFPVKSGSVISCDVTWQDKAEQGTLVFKLKKEVSSNTFTYPDSPPATVNIKSVRDQTPGLINGVSSLNVPLCPGGQPITFTIAQEYFKAVPSLAITDYVWQVPAGWQVVNPQTSAAFPGAYLSGRSISAIPPAGTTGGLVQAYQYSKACNENSFFNNAPGTLVSFPRQLVIFRPQPAVTGVTPSRNPLTCGDQRPFTLTAVVNQPGVDFFT